MNLYSRARKHIDMKRVKEMREDKVRKEKIAQEVIEQIREELRNINSPEFSNWRFDLKEGMTSKAMPPTGNPHIDKKVNESTWKKLNRHSGS